MYTTTADNPAITQTSTGNEQYRNRTLAQAPHVWAPIVTLRKTNPNPVTSQEMC